MKADLINKKIAAGEKVILDLGCGINKYPDAIGIDAWEGDNVDILHDVETGMDFIEDNSVDLVYSRHFLEHVENFELILKEIHRILKPGGQCITIVPHWSNPYYYSDYTHKRFFGLYSFDYFATEESMMKRKAPMYYNNFKFDITKRHINFTSEFFVRNLIKQVWKRLVNINNYTKEYYEEMCTGFIKAYEIRFEMTVKK